MLPFTNGSLDNQMRVVHLKLKQASAVLGVPPKELQNLVQHGVLRPRRGGHAYYFDSKLLLLAKIAFYVRASLRSAIWFLAILTKELSRVNLIDTTFEELLLTSSASPKCPPIQIKIPLRELMMELEESIPFAALVHDLPRGRKNRIHKEAENPNTTSDRAIVRRATSYRTRRNKPEIKLVNIAAQPHFDDI